MSHEDIVEAQAKRDAKDAVPVKGKLGRKRKNPVTWVAEVKEHGRVR
jgi:hypothetical protein